MPLPVLVCSAPFGRALRATEAAAAIGRGLERAGHAPPDLCPIADGGPGTLEVLLTALGGETAGAEITGPRGRPIRAGFALIEDGGTAIVEANGPQQPGDAATPSSRGIGELIAAAIDAGAGVVLIAAGGNAATDGGAGAVEALRDAGGPRGAKLVVLCDTRPPRDSAGGGLAGGLREAFGAVLEPGAGVVLDALGFDRRMRAARAVIVAEGRLDARTLDGKVVGEAATRARQAGVPCHAIVGHDDLDRFGKRILDLQVVLEAGTPAALEAAGEELGALLASGAA